MAAIWGVRVVSELLAVRKEREPLAKVANVRNDIAVKGRTSGCWEVDVLADLGRLAKEAVC